MAVLRFLFGFNSSVFGNVISSLDVYTSFYAGTVFTNAASSNWTINGSSYANVSPGCSRSWATVILWTSSPCYYSSPGIDCSWLLTRSCLDIQMHSWRWIALTCIQYTQHNNDRPMFLYLIWNILKFCCLVILCLSVEDLKWWMHLGWSKWCKWRESVKKWLLYLSI